MRDGFGRYAPGHKTRQSPIRAICAEREKAREAYWSALRATCRWCGKKSIYQQEYTGACREHRAELLAAYSYQRRHADWVLGRKEWGRKQGDYEVLQRESSIRRNRHRKTGFK